VCIHEISVEVNFYRNKLTSTSRSGQVSVDTLDHSINSFIDIFIVHSCNWKLDDEGNWVCLSSSPRSAVPVHNTFTRDINGLSLQVDAWFNALTAHFDDHYNQLDERI
ncbi:hypothetical protein Gotri_014959, partial [Gossypium trilobum]|nr:hypothetical protein [Gossypium trilobum]